MTSRRDPAYEELRLAEIEVAAPLLPAGGRVLEIGGGSGFQARELSRRGFAVTSVDLAGRPRPLEQVHPVGDYDGRTLDWPDRSFDAVFSSSVLEHVRDLPALLRETVRVTEPGGVAVHVVPGAAWRFWSLVGHYGFVLKRLVDPEAQVVGGHVDSPAAKARERGWGYVVRRALLPGPHGESASALHELLDLRRAAWERRLRDGGLAVRSWHRVEYFTTSHGLWRGLSIPARRRLARVLGSPVQVMVAAPSRAGARRRDLENPARSNMA